MVHDLGWPLDYICMMPPSFLLLQVLFHVSVFSTDATPSKQKQCAEGFFFSTKYDQSHLRPVWTLIKSRIKLTMVDLSWHTNVKWCYANWSGTACPPTEVAVHLMSCNEKSFPQISLLQHVEELIYLAISILFIFFLIFFFYTFDFCSIRCMCWGHSLFSIIFWEVNTVTQKMIYSASTWWFKPLTWLLYKQKTTCAKDLLSSEHRNGHMNHKCFLVT